MKDVSVLLSLGDTRQTPNQPHSLAYQHGKRMPCWQRKVQNYNEFFEGHYANLLHTGDTKEADNRIDNIMCQDIDIIFDYKSELSRFRFEVNQERH